MPQADDPLLDLLCRLFLFAEATRTQENGKPTFLRITGKLDLRKPIEQQVNLTALQRVVELLQARSCKIS